MPTCRPLSSAESHVVESLRFTSVSSASATLDEFIIERARARKDIVVTRDLDFSRILAASGGTAPSVIVLRLRRPTPTALADGIMAALTRATDDLRAGAIVTVEDAAIRVRMLPVAGTP